MSSSDGTIQLSLETDLRLHPQRLKLGQAELLTDAVTLPFEDIETRLNQYAIHSSQMERQKLCSSMKSYLGRLNANPLIPLDFRMKVLNRFEHELNLFDGEMTSAVLNAHKIGVDLVQREACKDSRYYAPLVEMIANAIELAVKILQLTVKEYKTTLVIVTRHFFDLARLGLKVAGELDAYSEDKRRRLLTAICRHELVRALDLFSKTSEQQQMILNMLEQHEKALDANLYSSSEPLAKLESMSCLVSNMNRPSDPPELIEIFDNDLVYEAIVIPVEELIRQINESMEHVETAIRSEDAQQVSLFTEETIQTTLIGGAAILNRLQPNQQRDPRVPCSKIFLQLEWDSHKSFASTSRSGVTPDPKHSWRVVDISNGGACIERLHEDSDSTGVGSIVELNWSSGDFPTLAMVRWSKQVKSGETRLGLMFMREPFKRVQAFAKVSGSEEVTLRRWPLLIVPGTGALTAYFPEAKIFPNLIFAINSNNEEIHFKVLSVVESGPNYCKCEIARARIRGEE